MGKNKEDQNVLEEILKIYKKQEKVLRGKIEEEREEINKREKKVGSLLRYKTWVESNAKKLVQSGGQGKSIRETIKGKVKEVEKEIIMEMQGLEEIYKKDLYMQGRLEGYKEDIYGLEKGLKVPKEDKKEVWLEPVYKHKEGIEELKSHQEDLEHRNKDALNTISMLTMQQKEDIKEDKLLSRKIGKVRNEIKELERIDGGLKKDLGTLNGVLTHTEEGKENVKEKIREKRQEIEEIQEKLTDKKSITSKQQNRINDLRKKIEMRGEDINNVSEFRNKNNRELVGIRYAVRHLEKYKKEGLDLWKLV